MSRHYPGLFAVVVALLIGCATPADRPDSKQAPTTSSPHDEEDRDMATVHTPLHVFQIDRYEASELRKGDFFAVPNQSPRVKITYLEARSICISLGKRLCTAFEWTNACLGTSRQRYGYGQVESLKICNTQGTGPEPTGSRAGCHSEGDVYDMIGNVMEWVENTDEPQGATAAGGSYHSGNGTDCFTSRLMPAETISGQVGFRCCK